MNSLSLTLLLLALCLSAAFASPVVTSRAISASLYDDFILYTKYSSAAYQPLCPKPLGKTLLRSFERGRTQGFIARDDDRQEIVVSFRGTFSLADAITDARFLLLPFFPPGFNESESSESDGIRVHRGFLKAHDDVEKGVLAIVTTQLALFPRFRVVVTGHSLGGAIASLSAPLLKAALPSATVALYTFGQPRVGNAEYASWVENTLGQENIYRTVHTRDGVPTMVPRVFKYRHFATEYWQFKDPLSGTPREDTVKRCIGGEDPTCSVRIPSGGINIYHTVYFGRLLVTPIPDLKLCF
ncbi:Alpha/Beta hydrolase protein [Mycena polygramma]|nr:Alpha/Beta hydrolase protein [Mycena polygramma]